MSTTATLATLRKRIVVDAKLPVYIPVGKPKTHIIECGACHKKKEVPIYRFKLCNDCFEKGDGGSILQGVTVVDQAKVAGFVREECSSSPEDPFY